MHLAFVRKKILYIKKYLSNLNNEKYLLTSSEINQYAIPLILRACLYDLAYPGLNEA